MRILPTDSTPENNAKTEITLNTDYENKDAVLYAMSKLLITQQTQMYSLINMVTQLLSNQFSVDLKEVNEGFAEEARGYLKIVMEDFDKTAKQMDLYLTQERSK